MTDEKSADETVGAETAEEPDEAADTDVSDELDETDEVDDEVDDETDVEIGDDPETWPEMSPEGMLFWEQAGVEPVYLALPSKGTGFTLRHYPEVDDEDEPEVQFLGRHHRVWLFRDTDTLAAVIRGDERHDLREAPHWKDVSGTEDLELIPEEVNRYELDLVVEALRAGPDAWDDDLIIAAGEVCRELGHYLDLTEVLDALGPGSPLDQLDDTLREGGWLARRKLRKTKPESWAVAWRRVLARIESRVLVYGEDDLSVPEEEEREAAELEAAEAAAADVDDTTEDDSADVEADVEDEADVDAEDEAPAEEPRTTRATGAKSTGPRKNRRKK
ncbi:MAG: hypothetical protein ACJ73S_08745 [Mycobacteriales bacterium]